MKKISKAFIRGIIPLTLMTTISLIMKAQGFDPYETKSCFIVGIISAAVSAATVIYEIEQWSLIKQTIVHFLTMLVTVFPCLLISGWFSLYTTFDYLKVFGFFVLVGLFLWTISYFIFGKLLSK